MGTTRREDDGTEVPWPEAVAAWAAAARPVLERAATQYNAFLTYQQLAEAVQDDTGITTGVPFRHWIGGVLGTVAAMEQPDEPILTSLVVRADGSVGDGLRSRSRRVVGSSPTTSTSTPPKSGWPATGSSVPTFPRVVVNLASHPWWRNVEQLVGLSSPHVLPCA